MIVPCPIALKNVGVSHRSPPFRPYRGLFKLTTIHKLYFVSVFSASIGHFPCSIPLCVSECVRVLGGYLNLH